ncbi:MAG TPA: Scr1 family TA system antitoxin-like transcriptional regulator, partial [Pseudonocardiaceae bacterium]
DRVVFQRQQIGGVFLDSTAKVAPFRSHASRLVAIALSPAESADLIAAIARSFERHGNADPSDMHMTHRA